MSVLCELVIEIVVPVVFYKERPTQNVDKISNFVLIAGMKS